MQRVLAAPTAILADLDPPRIVAAVLLRRVVALLALRARQGDNRSNVLLGHVASRRALGSALGRAVSCYSMISVITPAPTVSPPYRMANFEPFSSPTGVISSTVSFTSSPGITLSPPSGRAIVPVTSIVRM